MTAQRTKGVASERADGPPLTDEERDGMRLVAPAKRLREQFRMSREVFAAAYGIPLDKLTAWERRTAEPTEVELEYLRLIARDPERAKHREPEPA